MYNKKNKTRTSDEISNYKAKWNEFFDKMHNTDVSSNPKLQLQNKLYINHGNVAHQRGYVYEAHRNQSKP